MLLFCTEIDIKFTICIILFRYKFDIKLFIFVIKPHFKS